MTALHPALVQFRDDLRRAIGDDLRRHAARRRRFRITARVTVPAALAALGVSLALVLGSGPGISPADAAIVRSAGAALTPPTGSVLHAAAAISVGNGPPQRYELWATPDAFRVIKASHELSWNGTVASEYDSQANTIRMTGPVAPNHQAYDLAATLRSLIQSGRAAVTGTTVVDGVPAFVLRVSDLGSGWTSGAAKGTYEVAQADYRPLLVQTTVDCPGAPCTEVIRFTTYERLAATPPNLALLDLSAQHPGATVTGNAPQLPLPKKSH